MRVIHGVCCGLDVHKKLVVACLRVQDGAGAARTAVRRFETVTDALRELRGWLEEAGCTLVVMEATGPYWKPVYNVLEERDGLAVWVVNARHAKAVPGRKTDQNDASWLAELGAHGLVRPSFVPDRAQRELRELVRYRTGLLRERAAEVNRLQKVLEGANIKRASVVSDVTGVSARAMLAALVASSADAAALADLAVGRLREKRAGLERALAGGSATTSGSCWPSSWATSTSWTPGWRGWTPRSPAAWPHRTRRAPPLSRRRSAGWPPSPAWGSGPPR